MDRRITNVGFNTQAHVLTNIRRQERIHPFWGLRAAEEFIRDRGSALELAQFESNKRLRQIKRIQIKIERLKAKEFISELEALKLEDLTDELKQLNSFGESLESQFQDCQMELRVAQEEKSRILSLHPYLNSSSYETIQSDVTNQALLAKEANFIAGRILASRQHLPESIGDMLVSFLPEERDVVMNLVINLLESSTTQIALHQLVLALSEFSDQERQKFIEKAIYLVREYNLEAGSL